MAIIWLLIIAAILIVLFITKLSHLKHKFSTSAIVIFGLLIIVTFLKVANTNSVDLWSFDGFFSGLKIYFLWLGHFADNLRVVTGNVIRMDWFSVN